MPKPQTITHDFPEMVYLPSVPEIPKFNGFGSQTIKSNKTGLEASLRLGLAFGNMRRMNHSLAVCFGSGRVAILALTAFHGDDTASNAELFFLCWVTAQLLKRSLSWELSCRMQAEKNA